MGLGSEKNIFVFPRKYRHADSLAQSSPQILKSGLKRIKLICTSENESKDQIGDSCAIFVTLRNDAQKFCLTNKECFRAYKTAVNPSKICCKSTIAESFDRHPKKLIIRFRHVVKVFRLNNISWVQMSVSCPTPACETSQLPTL